MWRNHLKQYFRLEYHGVQPTTEAVPPPLFQAPSLHPSISAFIGHGPLCIPDQAPFLVCFEPVLPFAQLQLQNYMHLVVISEQEI